MWISRIAKKTNSVFILAVIITMALSFSARAEGANEAKTMPVMSVEIPNYTVISENVVDNPLKTHVNMEILVPGSVSTEGLKLLLGKLYSSIVNRPYKYHPSATNVYIYAYNTYENYKTGKTRFKSGKGQLIGMLSKGYFEIEPTITVNPLEIAGPASLKGEEKFGLTADERKTIWSKLIRAEDASHREADKSYPTSQLLQYPGTEEKLRTVLNEKLKYQQKVFSDSMDRIAKDYSLNREDVEDIMDEGIKNNWPYPEY